MHSKQTLPKLTTWRKARQVYLYVICWPHEVFHYLAARLFGLEARIEPGVTRFGCGPRWQLITVALAPAAVGVLPLAFCIWQWTQAEPRWVPFWSLLCLPFIGWYVACGDDFRSALRFWRDPSRSIIGPKQTHRTE